MSNFIIAVGHTASGNVGCVVIDRLDESNCNRQIGILVAEYLNHKGHGVNLLRVDASNTYNCEDCYERANKANEIAKTTDIELYVEIHINAGGGTGPEICVAGKSEVANQYAVKISNALASSLNLPNRGVKTRSLIVLNKTVMPAILIECLFADSSDADVYDPKVIARAIVNGLVGVVVLVMGNGKLDGIEMMWDGGIVIMMLTSAIIHQKMVGRRLIESYIYLIVGDMHYKMPGIIMKVINIGIT
jgi:N-acetylmuramoyl-L-alanine amidase